MKITKRILCIVLVAAMMFTFCSCRRSSDNDEGEFDYGTLSDGSDAKYDKELNGIYYAYNKSDEAVVVGSKSSASTLIIPDSVDGHPVTEIASRAFFYNTNLTTVSLPESVKIIGSEAFSECENLTSITISANVTSIGGKAFFSTAYIDQNTEEFLIVGDGILIDYSGSNTVVTIPDGVKTISSAFISNTAITEVSIPESVTEIGSYSFSSCVKLEKINLPSGITTIGERAFTKCLALQEIVIPDSVTTVGTAAFMFCSSATSVKFSAAMTKIPSSCFLACYAIQSIEIPSNITSIGANAFARCKALASVSIPDSVIEIGKSAFIQASGDLQISCSAGSAAEKYCKKANIQIAQ